jgi:hypothetical protein
MIPSTFFCAKAYCAPQKSDQANHIPIKCFLASSAPKLIARFVEAKEKASVSFEICVPALLLFHSLFLLLVISGDLLSVSRSVGNLFVLSAVLFDDLPLIDV